MPRIMSWSPSFIWNCCWTCDDAVARGLTGQERWDCERSNRASSYERKWHDGVRGDWNKSRGIILRWRRMDVTLGTKSMLDGLRYDLGPPTSVHRDEESPTMPSVKQNLRELAKHAIAKKGAQQSSTHCNFDVLELPCVQLPGTTWGTFFEEGDDPFARMPVLADRLKEHQKRYPVIRESGWGERDGHIYMDVPLDGEPPLDFIKSLIDEAYAIVWNKLNADARLKIELAGQPYDEPKLLDRLIEIHDLKAHRKEIRKIVRPAILLRTKKSSEAKIPLGASKIGGRPDLPKGAEWPAYRDGKPLAFLAQIDLKEIAKL